MEARIRMGALVGLAHLRSMPNCVPIDLHTYSQPASTTVCPTPIGVNNGVRQSTGWCYYLANIQGLPASCQLTDELGVPLEAVHLALKLVLFDPEAMSLRGEVTRGLRVQRHGALDLPKGNP